MIEKFWQAIKNRRRFWWMGSVGLVGLGLVFFIPPFQKPDETSHYLRALTVARGQFFCRITDEGQYFSLPRGYTLLAEEMRANQIKHRYEVKFPITLLSQSIRATSPSESVAIPNLCALSFIGYVPLAIAMILALPYQHPLWLFYAARIGALLFYLGALWVAYRVIHPPFRRYLSVFTFIPMVLHQVTAVSYDSFQFGIGLIIFAWTTRMIWDPKVKALHWWLGLGLTLLIILTKPGYYALALLGFIATPNKLRVSKHRYLLMQGSYLMVVASWVILFSIITSAAVQHTSLYPLANPRLQFEVLKALPMRFLTVMGTTIEKNSQYYVESMIGTFGWLDYRVHYAVLILITNLIIRLLYMPVKNSSNQLTLRVGIWLTVMVVGVIGGLFLAMYMVGTPVAAREISGVQGRYFLPLLPFGLLLVSRLVQSKARWGVYGLLVGVLIWSVCGSIYSRYYDYSRLTQPETYIDGMMQADYQKKLEVVPVEKPIRLQIPAGVQMIKGFSVGTVKSHGLVSTPYMYSVYDSMCRRLLYRDFFDPVSMNTQPIQTEYFNLYLTHIPTPLCVVISPLDYMRANGSIALLKENEKFAFTWLVPDYEPR